MCVVDADNARIPSDTLAEDSEIKIMVRNRFHARIRAAVKCPGPRCVARGSPIAVSTRYCVGVARGIEMFRPGTATSASQWQEIVPWYGAPYM